MKKNIKNNKDSEFIPEKHIINEFFNKIKKIYSNNKNLSDEDFINL